MDTDPISGARQARQDVIAPEVRQFRGEINALDARIDTRGKVQRARFSEVNAKLESKSA